MNREYYCQYCTYKGAYFEDVPLQKKTLIDGMMIAEIVLYKKCPVCGSLIEVKNKEMLD